MRFRLIPRDNGFYPLFEKQAAAAVDTAIQLNGARGYSGDTPLEWIYRYARQARLVDGASEVHKMVLAKFFMKERGDFWSWQ